MSARYPSRRGFSLAEVAMASAVLAVGASAVLGVVGQVGARRQDTVARAVGSRLAADLLARIASLPLADPQTGAVTMGTDAGESSVTQYDDVTDYDAYSEATIVDASGVAMSGTTGLSRAVTVEWLASATGSAVSATPTTSARITVVAKWRGKPVATVVGIRTLGWENGRP